MNLIELENKEYRRDILQLLAQDADYSLPSYVLQAAMAELGNPIASSRLDNQLQWLQGLVELSSLSQSVNQAKLTRYGLDVANGLSSVIGVAKLRL